ncbi:MAG: polysaccharide biosynthesis/export family protein, partial [Bacteroidaceae bacterium]|nr:polysaccharide biosynthesis/export family protein [Bacteroidaceae bacterium]
MKKIFAVFGFLLLLTACKSTKDISYFQDTLQESTAVVTPKQITLRPQDKLTVIVNTRNQELTNMFNLAYVTKQLGTTTNYGTGQGISCYTVDNEGNIDFPILGKVNVEGKTRTQIARQIKDELIK